MKPETYTSRTDVGQRLWRLAALGSPQSPVGWPTKGGPAPGEAATPGQGSRISQVAAERAAWRSAASLPMTAVRGHSSRTW
jgi:hypothetical protein